MVEPGSPVRFTTTVELGGKAATGFEVPVPDPGGPRGPDRRGAGRGRRTR